MEISRVIFSKWYDAVSFAFELNRQSQMIDATFNAIANPRLGQSLSGCQKMPGLFEDPRIPDGAAPDHDAVAAGFQHGLDVLWRRDIAIPDERYGNDLLDLLQPMPIGIAIVGL